MLSATVTLDLTRPNGCDSFDLDRLDRHSLQCLPEVPDGARLIVKVGDRELLFHSAIAWLSQHSRRLHIEIAASTPKAARRWYDAIKSGEVDQ